MTQKTQNIIVIDTKNLVAIIINNRLITNIFTFFSTVVNSDCFRFQFISILLLMSKECIHYCSDVNSSNIFRVCIDYTNRDVLLVLRYSEQ